MTETIEATWQPSAAGLRAGVVASLPILPAVAPFGVVFGALAVESGFGPVQALSMAALVVAGASQLAALQLLNEGAPFLVIVATAAVVNLRLAMYSASLAPYWRGVPTGWRALAAFGLHDQDYALSLSRYRARPEEGPGQRLGFYLGTALATFTVWIAATLAGVMLGEGLPEEWGLGFIVPLAFLALVAPMIRSRPEALAALTALAVGAALAHLPYRTGLFVAAAAGIAVGMAARRLPSRRREARR